MACILQMAFVSHGRKSAEFVLAFVVREKTLNIYGFLASSLQYPTDVPAS